MNDLNYIYKFVSFLEDNGLNPVNNKSILEISDSGSFNVSRVLLKKYGELYKVFLTSLKFKYKNKYGIDGVRGDASVIRGKLCFDVCRTSLNDRFLTRETFSNMYRLPKGDNFDTILCFGNFQKFLSLIGSEHSKFFGLIWDIDDYQVRRNMIELVKLINRESDIKYGLVSKNVEDKAYYLIKKRFFKSNIQSE